jgi:DeoR/GlpR family transcriptional regulator of sugar metabolism
METMVQTVAADDIDHLVTDADVPPAQLRQFRDRGVQVHVARGGGPLAPAENPEPD